LGGPRTRPDIQGLPNDLDSHTGKWCDGRPEIFERFTERAREVVQIAQSEARRLAHNYIGTEHLLLSLSQIEHSVSADVLESLNVEPTKVQAAIESIIDSTPEPPQGQIPFTPRAKKTLELGLREALSLGDNYIGTEHLLLGLAREMEGVAAHILREMGLDQETIRDAVIAAMESPIGIEEREQAPARKSLRSKRASARASVSKDDPEHPEEARGEVAPEEEEEEGEAIEAVPTHRDRPATRDELGRNRLASVLGERIRRVRSEDTESPVKTCWDRRRKRVADSAAARLAGSFMVHVHAPWGAGKSSLLNFLAVDLRNRDTAVHSTRTRTRRLADFLLRPRRPANPNLSQWIVVEFSAWEHQRLVAPWWWLLAAVQRSCTHELWHINRGQWLWFWVRDVAWRIWNARAALITLLLLASLLTAAWVFDWFGLPDKPLTTVSTVVLTIGATITLIGSVVGLARGTSRWLAIGSAEGAVRFLKRAHDPLGVYRRRFRWLVRSSGRPITVFIDDLDRCRPAYVVELLEGIQTLFAAEPVTYVVAADRAWLCESFATAYSEFEDSVGNPGRPLGFLFLEKTFQISLEIPPMSHHDRSRYWDTLMRGIRNGSSHAKRRDDGSVGKMLADASTQAEIEDGVGDLLRLGADQEEVLLAAVRRLNAPDMQEQLEKLLSEFAPLLENNPRSMKRLMNAYGIERDRLLRDGYLLTKTERRQLALLTILRLRWPLFAEHLRANPSDVKFCDGATGVPDEHSYAALFCDPDVRRLFDGSHISERLDPDQLENFPGRAPGSSSQAGLGSPASSA
jgi:KAP family P-loop domain/Clp amino terminal domain, pathogenicity island component